MKRLYVVTCLLMALGFVGMTVSIWMDDSMWLAAKIQCTSMNVIIGAGMSFILWLSTRMNSRMRNSMTDKDRIKAWANKKLSEVESKIGRLFGISESMYPELIAERVVLKDLIYLIDSMKEEPVSRQPVEEAVADVEEKAKAFTEAHKGKSSEEVLAEMRGEEPLSDELDSAALEYANGELIKAGVTDENCPREMAVAQAILMVNGFKAGSGWQREKDEHLIWQLSAANYEKGKQEAREQMLKEAVDGYIMGNSYYRHKDVGLCKLSDEEYDRIGDFGDNVKVVIIKEE